MNPRSDLKKLLTTWGIEFNNKKAVLDLARFRIARKINGRDIQVTNYPWLNIRVGNGLNKNDSTLSNLSTIVMTTAGSLKDTNENPILEPIIRSSKKIRGR